MSGIPGCIHGFDVDTSYFVGNYPPKTSIQAAVLPLERNQVIINNLYMDFAVSHFFL
jgi:allantoicase